MEREEGLEVARRSGIAGSGAEPGRSLPCLRFPEGRRSSVTPGGWVLGVRTRGTRGGFSSRGVAEAPLTAGTPGGEPPLRASVSPAAAAPHHAACADARAELAGGRGAPAGGLIRPCRGRPGHRKHPPTPFQAPACRSAGAGCAYVCVGRGRDLPESPPGTQPLVGGGCRGKRSQGSTGAGLCRGSEIGFGETEAGSRESGRMAWLQHPFVGMCW